MTPQQALEIVSQACDQFVGKKQDHMTIQQALNTLASAIAPQPPDAQSSQAPAQES